ncbi:MAG: ABC transporter ATP-binding protein, partial [Asticcacaulis sp.]|nr:ABC transporter ATP-binding protein [Asticcacaulis sp.]
MVTLDSVSIALGGRTVVDGVSVELKPGRLHVVAGPNGAGKSTLLKAIAGLLPLAKGQIRLDDADVARLNARQRAERLAYLPQERTVAWDLPAVDIAALGARHLAPEVARQKAFAELESLGLKDDAVRGVFRLSGGQRARVLLARVLLTPVRIFVLDEPLTALDPAWQRHILTRLKQRAAEGQTIVISLHDLHLTAQFADEVLLMQSGKLITAGAPEKAFTSYHLREVFKLKGDLVRDEGTRML